MGLDARDGGVIADAALDAAAELGERFDAADLVLVRVEVVVQLPGGRIETVTASRRGGKV